MLGDEAPKDRRCLGSALELYHAGLHGQFPCPGSLRDQPRRVNDAYQFLLVLMASQRRMAATMGMGGLAAVGAEAKAAQPKSAAEHWPGGPLWQRAAKATGTPELEMLRQLETAKRQGDPSKFWAWCEEVGANG